MATYRYLFYDISTKRLIDTLPMEQVSYGWELSGVGTFTGQIPMYSDDFPSQRIADAVLPYRTKVFVERDGMLVWGGWINAEPGYDSSSGILTVTAEETLGYFAVRTMPTVEYRGVDQLPMACAFLDSVQEEPGGDMWMHTDPSVLSGRVRDRSFSQYDQSPVLTALTQLSEVIDGFDFASQVVWVGGLPHESLMLGYPRLGRVGSASGVVFEFNRFVGGGNIETYTWADAGTPMATRSWANTETDEGVQLTARCDRPDLIADGYPIMEYGENFDGIVDSATLQAHADALGAYRSGPRVVAHFTAVAQPGLQIGDFQLGDDVLVRISDWRWPPDPETGAPGFIGYLRITGVSVTAGDEGEEQYEFTCGDIITH